MQDLVKDFKKTAKSKQIVLVSAVVAFIATFLPWAGVSFGSWGSYSINGWHSFGWLTILASIAIVALWVLPLVGKKLDLPVKDPILSQGLAVIMLAGPVLWIFNLNFELGLVGAGLWVALVAGAVATYFSFQKK